MSGAVVVTVPLDVQREHLALLSRALLAEYRAIARDLAIGNGRSTIDDLHAIRDLLDRVEAMSR